MSFRFRKRARRHCKVIFNTAALYLFRVRYRVLVLEKEQFGGQIMITSEVVHVMSVPCLVTDDGGVTFGKKNIAQLIEWLSAK